MTDDLTREETPPPTPTADAAEAVPDDRLASEVTLVTPGAADDAGAGLLTTEPAPLPPAGRPGREAVDAVRDLGERLERRLDALHAVFEREVRAEATREKVVDRLHAELQEYKHDLLLNTLRPVFLDLIQLHDDVGKVTLAGAGDHAEAPDEVRRLLNLMAGFQQGIEDILYRQGVEPYQVEGDAFDPRRQRAVATVAADDPAAVKTVAARHRKGFRSGDKVIRPEMVSVFSLKK